MSTRVDKLGRPMDKQCSCNAWIGRTLRKCPLCGHQFTGRGKHATVPSASLQAALQRTREPHPLTGEPPRPVIAPAGPPHYFAAPLPITAIDRMTMPSEVPADAPFVASVLPNGGMKLFWPAHNITFTLTPYERELVRKADRAGLY